MERFWAEGPSAEFWVLVGFHLFVLAILVLDMGVLRRRAQVVTTKEAAVWSLVWIAFAFLFALGIWRYWHLWQSDKGEAVQARSGIKAIEFVTGYLIELSLSVDNLFVFLVIFRYFAVPDHLRHRVLFWGILGAVIMRASFILLGAALLHMFHWLLYVLGAFLIFTGYKLAHSIEEKVDPSRNLVLRAARRFLPIVDNYESTHFWVRREGRLFATPLLLVLLVIESTDVIFAVDSIPAIFGITQDTFIVYTSNIFAILGLRSLYFLVANLLGAFRYLSKGLALVLAFVGLKMLFQDSLIPYLKNHGIEQNHLIFISLGTIITILGVAILASILAGPEKTTGEGEELPDKVIEVSNLPEERP